MTSASGLPTETVLLKYMDSKMIRKDFRSIKESISATLSSTDRRLLYSSSRVKSVRVFINENYCQEISTLQCSSA